MRVSVPHGARVPASPVSDRAHGLPDPASVDRPWIGSYPPGVPPTYRYPAVAVTRFLDDAARDFPGQAATWLSGAELDYASLREQTDRFAASLRDLGVGPGDRVATLLPNLPASLIATFAAWRLGAVAVCLESDDALDESRRRLAATGAKVVVGLSSRSPELVELRRELPDLEQVIVTGLPDWLTARGRLLSPLAGPWRGRLRRTRPGDDVLSMVGLIESAGSVPAQVPVRPDDAAVIQFSGGTTGPAGVVLSHGNLVASAFQARLWVPDTQAGKERILAVLPFSHVLGLTAVMLAGVLCAQTLVLLPRRDVGETMRAIARRRPSLLAGTSEMFEAIVEHADAHRHELGSLRACLAAGGSLAPAVVERFESLTRGARLREVYGPVEAGGMTHANPVYGRSRPGTIGLPVTDTVACVVDPDDPTVRVEPGAPGELIVLGPQVMAGYWPGEGDAEDPVRDGWLLTGDIVVADEDGFFTFVERKKRPTELRLEEAAAPGDATEGIRGP